MGSLQPEPRQIRRTLFLLGSGFTAAHSMQLGTLMASLAYATNDLTTAFWAFLIQQAIEPVTELTTSHFADRRGRRLSVTLAFAGLAFLLLTALLPHRTDLLLLVAAAQLAYLMGTSFISGALEAWSVDSLRRLGAHGTDFDRLFARLNLYKNTAVVAGGGIGILVLLVSERPWGPWLLFSAGSLVLAWLAFSRMGEMPPVDEIRPVPSLAGAMGLVLKRCRQNRNLAIYIVDWALQYGFWGLLAYFWVPLLLDRLDTAALHHWVWASAAWLFWCGARITAASVALALVRRALLRSETIISLSAFATILPVLVYLLVADGLSAYLELGAFFLAILTSKMFEVAITGVRMARLNAHIQDTDSARDLHFDGICRGCRDDPDHAHAGHCVPWRDTKQSQGLSLAARVECLGGLGRCDRLRVSAAN